MYIVVCGDVVCEGLCSDMDDHNFVAERSALVLSSVVHNGVRSNPEQAGF